MSFKIVLLTAALAVIVTPVAAQIPAVANVPDCATAGTRSQLEPGRSALLQRRDALRSRVAEHNGRCSQVVAGSAAEGSCQSSQGQLNQEISQYSQAVAAFNRQVEAACHTPSATPASAPVPPLPTWVSRVATTLNAKRGEIPLPFLLGWIHYETGGSGDFRAVSKNGERGYFQIDPFEWCLLHHIGEQACKTKWDRPVRTFRDPELEKGFEKLSTDSDYSLEWGISMVRMHERAVKGLKLGCDENNKPAMFWHMVKLVHATNLSAVDKVMQEMRAQKVPMDSWDSVRAYILRQDGARLKQLTHEDVKHWVPEVDKLFDAGPKLSAAFEPPATSR